MTIKNTLETIQIYYNIRCYTETVGEQIIRDIRKCSMTGRPCGGDRFMSNQAGSILQIEPIVL